MPRWSNQFRTATLDPASISYRQGYHKGNTGGLPGVDADLVTGSIKSGVTLFGVAGSASVLDVSDANAAVGDVKSPKTFYSVTGPRKDGTMPTVAIVAANDNYPAGYHVGDVGGLDAIDVNLASANIKSGVTIFGKAGVATVQEIGAADAAVTDVKAPRTFFSVTGGIKTGTLATVALDPALNAYPAGYHAGAASLTAVDADLATGNIKSGVTIFGVLGTYAQTLSQDLVASAITALTGIFSDGFFNCDAAIGANAEVDIATTTNVFNAASMAVGVGFWGNTGAQFINSLKCRLYMDGVQVAESAFLASAATTNIILIATKALSGNKIVKTTVKESAGAPCLLYIGGGVPVGAVASAGVAVGSIKVA